jgi:hypothetical protein
MKFYLGHYGIYPIMALPDIVAFAAPAPASAFAPAAHAGGFVEPSPPVIRKTFPETFLFDQIDKLR